MNKLILLPHAGKGVNFKLSELVKYFKSKKLPFMVIGSSHVSYANHKKKHSLDIWLRNRPVVKRVAKNTCQSANSVIKQILATGIFKVQPCVCLTSGRLCKSLVLKKKK